MLLCARILPSLAALVLYNLTFIRRLCPTYTNSYFALARYIVNTCNHLLRLHWVSRARFRPNGTHYSPSKLCSGTTEQSVFALVSEGNVTGCKWWKLGPTRGYHPGGRLHVVSRYWCAGFTPRDRVSPGKLRAPSGTHNGDTLHGAGEQVDHEGRTRSRREQTMCHEEHKATKTLSGKWAASKETTSEEEARM